MSTFNDGTPSTRESDILVAIQDRFFDRSGCVSAARGLSHYGEHALGWMGLALCGWLMDRRRRKGWRNVFLAAILAHALSIIIKRLVRRPRPHDPRIRVGVGTPSALSFPSSHAASTTAALVAVCAVTGKKWPLAGIPVMMFSRMLLGVHYPSDVAAGAVLGVGTALVVGRCGASQSTSLKEK